MIVTFEEFRPAHDFFDYTGGAVQTSTATNTRVASRIALGKRIGLPWFKPCTAAKDSTGLSLVNQFHGI
jgi:hypothetical protein